MAYRDPDYKIKWTLAHKEEKCVYDRARYLENHAEMLQRVAFRRAQMSPDERAVQQVYAAEYYQANRTTILARNRAYTEEHPEVAKKAKAQWEAAHPKYIYPKRAPGDGRKKRGDPEKERATAAKYRGTHQKELRAQQRVWVDANPEKVQATNARRRARKRNAPVNDFTGEQWLEIKAAYGHRCVYCGRKMQRLTMDHITPLCRGGSHTASNIVPSCKSCNSKKHVGPPLKQVQPLLLTLASARIG